MEKSNIEILSEFARNTNRAIVSKEIPYPLTGIRTFQQYKRMIYISNNSENTSFLIWFSDPYAKVGLPTIYCGAFIPLPTNVKSKIKIRNRNTLDRLNVFSKTKTILTGNNSFDSKVVISGNMDSSAKELLSRSKTQYQLLKALKIEKLMTISLNEYKIDFLPELSNTPYIAILNQQGWNLDRDCIENMFKEIESLRNTITD